MSSRILTFVIALPLLVSFLNCGGESCNAERNKEIFLGAIEAMNNHDLDKLDQYIAEDYVRHCQATPDVNAFFSR